MELNNLFHSTLIRYAGNPLITAFYDNILELIGMQIATTDGLRFYKSHLEIVDTLSLREPLAVAAVMSQHFSNKFPNYEYYDHL